MNHELDCHNYIHLLQEILGLELSYMPQLSNISEVYGKHSGYGLSNNLRELTGQSVIATRH